MTLDIPRDLDQEINVPVEPLRKLLVDIYVGKGMFEFEAEIGADRLIEADLRGIHSHGSRCVVKYVEAMDLGHIDPRAQMITLNETPAIGIIEASKGLGHVAATRGMEMAIKKAKEVGTGTVAVRKGEHFGAASVYPLMAIEAGMIGYCTTNTGPASVAAFGSKQAATANNAFAWGVPTREGAPFVLDMACAISSWGKIFSLDFYNQPIPDGWALDAEGNPTTDHALAKTLLPAAGARGYGLAFLSSVLAGPLVGGKMPLHKNRGPLADDSEHFFYAIDIAQFVDPDVFYKELESTMAEIRALEPAEGFDKVRLPGELEWERTQQWREEGIPLHRQPIDDLGKLAASLKIDVPW